MFLPPHGANIAIVSIYRTAVRRGVLRVIASKMILFSEIMARPRTIYRRVRSRFDHARLRYVVAVVHPDPDDLSRDVDI